jgi:hypothetical protein
MRPFQHPLHSARQIHYISTLNLVDPLCEDAVCTVPTGSPGVFKSSRGGSVVKFLPV